MEIPQIGATTMVRASRSKKDETFIEMAMGLMREHGPIVQMPGTTPRTLVVSNFALVDELSDDQRFDKTLGKGLRQLRGLAGDSLFTAYTTEPNWSKAHNILLPAFSRQAMKDYLPDMIDLASQLVLKWERLNPKDVIDVPQDMTRLTIDTIGLCGFNYRFNSFYRTDQHPLVVAMVDALTRTMSTYGGGHPLFDALVRRVHPPNEEEDVFSTDENLRHDREVMNATVDKVIKARKAEGPEGMAAQRDLLGYMLTGRDRRTGETLDDVTIRYEIIVFLVAGHETTSGLLSFAIYFLLKNPDVLARAYEEVHEILGTDLSARPTFEQVHRLRYISQILKESMRLWPPLPAFTRHPLQDTTLGGKYAVHPDDIIMVLTPMVQRDPTVWGMDAEEFNPEHFSPEAEQKRPANAFKAFGTGQRSCIGREFAMQEAKLVLGMLLQRFALIDFSNYELRLKQTQTIKPDNFKIRVRPRVMSPRQQAGR